MLSIPNVGVLEMLAQLLASWFTAGTVLHLRLYQNNVVPGPNDTLATYTEATFDGYTGGTVAEVGTPYINASGQGEQDFQLVNYTQTGVTVTNTIYGYYVGIKIGAGAESLLWAERFDSPILMDTAGKQINVAPQLTAVSAF